MERRNMILEYNEQEAQWHYNMVYDNRPSGEPDTSGWASIAYTDEEKARIFTYTMDCKMAERENAGLAHLTVSEMRREWKYFCLVYNGVIKNINVTPELKKEVSDRFDATRLLARLGHRSFSYLVEDEDLDPAEEYDPLNYGDANY